MPKSVIPQHGSKMPMTTHEMMPQREMVQRHETVHVSTGKSPSPRAGKQSKS